MRRIKEKKEIIVAADKTDNHYLIPVYDYRRLEKISKDYKIRINKGLAAG